MNLNSSQSSIMKRFNYRDLIIFLLPALIFSLYIFVYNPGILTAGSFSQLHQIATGEFSSAYPIFHTLIEMICLKIYASPISIGIFQTVVFCIIWMFICKYHRDDSTSDEFVFQFIITLIISVIPINAVYAITLSPNILFSYALVFICFLIKVMVDKDGQIDSRLAILMGLTIACVGGLSTYGIYIALILLAIIAVYLFVKNAEQNTIIMLSSIAIVCIVLILSMNFVFNVESQDNGNFPMNDAFEDGVDLQSARSQFFSSTNEVPSEGYENATSANLKNSKYGMIDSFVNLSRENFILDGLLNSPILYMILSVILLGFIFITTKSKEIVLVFIPNLLNMIMVAITGQVNLYSNLLVCYLIIVIFISLWIKGSLKPQEIAKTSKPQKTYEPAKPEESSFEPEEEYIDFESELEDLTLEDIDEMLEDTPTEPDSPKEENTSEGEPDLIDEILEEMELDKK